MTKKRFDARALPPNTTDTVTSPAAPSAAFRPKLTFGTSSFLPGASTLTMHSSGSASFTSTDISGTSGYSGISFPLTTTQAHVSGADREMVAEGFTLGFFASAFGFFSGVAVCWGLSRTRTYPPGPTSTVSTLRPPISRMAAVLASTTQRCLSER